MVLLTRLFDVVWRGLSRECMRGARDETRRGLTLLGGLLRFGGKQPSMHRRLVREQNGRAFTCCYFMHVAKIACKFSRSRREFIPERD